MAGAMYGADAEELEAIAQELEGYEQELGQLLLEGVGAVSLVGLSATLGSIWRGPRSQEFAGLWQSRHLLRIRDVQATLREAAADLRANAAEQRSTSSARGPLPFAIPDILDLLPPWFGGLPKPPPHGGGGDWAMPLPFPMHPGGWLGPFFGVPGFGGAWPSLDLGDLIEGSKLGLEIGQIASDWRLAAKPFYLGLMGGVKIGSHHFGITGLAATIADLRNHDDALSYFNSAKGGFRSAASKMGLVEHGAGLKLAAVGAVLSGGSALYTGVTEGFGSSAFAESAVDNGIGAVVGFVPGGGIAYEGGKLIGDQIFHRTPVGDWMMDSNPVSGVIGDADRHMAKSDELLRQGNYEAAIRESERASEAARRAREESEGWKGMWNASGGTVIEGTKNLAKKLKFW